MVPELANMDSWRRMKGMSGFSEECVVYKHDTI